MVRFVSHLLGSGRDESKCVGPDVAVQGHVVDKAFVVCSCKFGQAFGLAGGFVEAAAHLEGDHLVVRAVDDDDGTGNRLEGILSII